MKTFIHISRWVKEEMAQEGYSLTGRFNKMCIRRELRGLI
jgi:hypothetical protein